MTFADFMQRGASHNLTQSINNFFKGQKSQLVDLGKEISQYEKVLDAKINDLNALLAAFKEEVAFDRSFIK